MGVILDAQAAWAESMKPKWAAEKARDARRHKAREDAGISAKAVRAGIKAYLEQESTEYGYSDANARRIVLDVYLAMRAIEEKRG